MESILKFISANKDALTWLLGPGVLLVVVRWTWAYLKQRRQRLIPSDAFPFEVIKPQNGKVIQQLLGSSSHRSQPIFGGSTDETDALEDFNIPYQVRQADHSVRRELERLLDEKRWVLILGRTGLGKTREAAELAQILNNEGWTVLKLTDQGWLDVPRKFPGEEIGSQRKLLFFLDDLNIWMYRGQRELTPEADQPFQPLKIPFQERLLRVLEFYEDECRPEQIRVLATARNENIRELPHKPSEWEKLEFEKYPKLWDRFGLYHLAEPEDQAVIDLLVDIVPTAKVQVDPKDFARIAQRNDRSFRNIVENLRIAQSRNLPLAPETFPETLDKTWRKRYKDAVSRYPFARYIYDAVELLQAVNVELYSFTVAPTARLIVGGHFSQRLWYRWKIDRALQYLIKTEHILEPRDGQIAGKENQIEVGEYIPRLSRLILQLADRYPHKLILSLLGFADASYNLKRYREALISINKLLGFISNFEPAWFLKGNILARLNRYEEAIASYDQALTIKPDFHEAWYNRGVALGNLNRYDEAIASYDRALTINPDDHEAWYNWGVALMHLNRYDEAIASHDRALTTNPDDHEAWYNRGVALKNLNRYDEAIASYDQALTIKPDFHEAWYNRGVALGNLNRYEEAIASYDQALTIKPDFHEAWCNRGGALGNLNRYEEEIASYDQALTTKPDYYAAWYNRGVALMHLNRYEEAIASHDQALIIKPDFHEAWYNRGIALGYLNRYEEEIASYDQALTIKSNFHEAWYNRGIALGYLNRYEEEIASYDQALTIKPDKHEAWYNRGVTLGSLNRYEEEIASYDQALNIKPDKHEAWYNRGFSLMHLNRYEEAIASHDKALNIKPDKHEAWYNRGFSLMHLNRYEEAIASHDKALNIKPDKHEAWYNRGFSLMHLNRYEEAIASFDKALELQPNDPEAFYQKARNYALLNKFDLAIENLQSVMSLDLEACIEIVKVDSAFEELRTTEQFQAFLNSYINTHESGRSEGKN